MAPPAGEDDLRLAHWPAVSGPCFDPALGPRVGPPIPPCQRMVEPCNGIDDNGDGITDPGCGTRPCATHADCTYGGAHLGDDCDLPGGGFCDNIHGPDHAGAANHACEGVTCPAGTMCFAGDCVPPGPKLPGERCNDGSECGLAMGCIPATPYDLNSKVCVAFCHEYDCPTGFVCVTEPLESGATESRCEDAAPCAAGQQACGETLAACFDSKRCHAALSAWSQCLTGHEDDATGLRECVSAEASAAVVACLTAACPGE